ncbi:MULTISPECIES: TetR/AcrR family transcriptional regulator [Mycobacteriaceae]|uniref:TetR/AcrR family transcriptional regulator n=1 Tax=Mycobacteriaceae TaxID=1762 RepID=UPI0010813A08|nr:TetR/AcrR family transcriptional regulator [Mycobacterium sp. DL99]
MPSRQRTTPTQQRSEATVDAILDAAERVLAEDGYRRFSTNRIAKVASFSIGTVYRYFADKAAIIEAMRARAEADIMRQLTDAVVQMKEIESSEVAVTTFLRALIEALEAHADVLQAVSNELPFGAQFNVLPDAERQLGDLVRLAVETRVPHIDSDKLDATLYLSIGATLAVATRIAIGRPSGISRDLLIETANEVTLPYARLLESQPGSQGRNR